MKNLKEYLLENEEILKNIVNELNFYNGCLDWLNYQANDEDFFNIYFYNKPAEAVRACYFGDYNYNDEYVSIDVYGNLESCSEYEYYDKLKNYIDDIIDCLIDNKDNIYIYDETLKSILES